MYARRSRPDGPPLFVIVVIVALLIFGCYSLWAGFADFTRNTALQGIQALQTRTILAQTPESVRATSAFRPTFPPTWTPPPPCVDFVVMVESAVVRSCPAADCRVVGGYQYGETVCVLRHVSTDSEWYEIEQDVDLRTGDIGYMHRNVIKAADPTPEPTLTHTPLPTVTPGPSNTLPATRTPAPTYTPLPTATPDSNLPTPLPTVDFQVVKSVFQFNENGA
ncbi:MAG: hypothetical protein JXB47_11940 [Anaerolineae bacterium]|nr:hypothetical protein [Anaerolineae bacterium]